ncbi:putative kinetochore protein SPC25 [Hypsizygus marmoreus]|uniref:Kinetochore protein SPC25 n=1 Tax=Hypsizygus marmoreus TaxID=39966 RepID=A0A369JS51_HYPMA|nr:putative kinetochore protein SPC25 [Hypsizygus marmoreus]
MARVLRLPQIDLISVLAEPTPTIDLRLSAYDTSTRNFLKAVAHYKNRAIGTITDRRTGQAAEKKKVLEKTQTIEVETNQCKLREIELVADLEREKEERKDAELSVAAFKRQLASLREKCTSIEAEIEQYRAITSNLRRERNKERSTLHTHASHISPELTACESHLFCIVEGIEKDQLLVRFSDVSASDPEREFSFVIDVSDRVFKVVTSSPPLLTMPILVDALNDSRDVYDFIRQVRMAYQMQVNGTTL